MSDWGILEGDCIERLRELPAASVHCVVTSPPYFGLRDYSTGTWEGGSPECDHKGGPRMSDKTNIGRSKGKDHQVLLHAASRTEATTPFKDVCGKCGAVRVDKQIGLESTPAEFVAKMVEVFAEVWRVLRADGTVWLNLGDSYAGAGQGGGGNRKGNEHGQHDALIGSTRGQVPEGLKPKDLMLMPARVAIALQEWGWWVRSDIIWCKRAPMPESVTDRPTSAHEHIFLLTKAERYFYDADAIREGHARDYSDEGWANVVGKQGNKENSAVMRHDGNKTWAECMNPAGRNAWNYWLLSPEPYAAAHFATFPTEIPRRAIKAGTSEWGCCGECGAPYRRVVERSGVTTTEKRKALGTSEKRGQGGVKVVQNLDYAGGHGSNQRDSITTGWQPTCKHTDAPLVPCTVLDPFNGAGTTGLVATQLGRRYIGIELSPDYVEMSKRRIRDAMPLFAYSQEVAEPVQEQPVLHQQLEMTLCD